MVDIASSSSTYRKIMESFADSSSSSEDEEQEFNLLFKSMLSDSVSSNASIFTAKSSMSRPESVDKSNEHLIAVETSRDFLLNSDLANTEQRISASSSKSFGRSNISDSTSKIRNLESESSSSQIAGPSNLPQTETVGETKTGILYPLESGPALGRVALKRNRKQL